ncbi:hypothetical protein ScPMuIL_014362 [Solemya velum]
MGIKWTPRTLVIFLYTLLLSVGVTNTKILHFAEFIKDLRMMNEKLFPQSGSSTLLPTRQTRFRDQPSTDLEGMKTLSYYDHSFLTAIPNTGDSNFRLSSDNTVKNTGYTPTTVPTTESYAPTTVPTTESFTPTTVPKTESFTPTTVPTTESFTHTTVSTTESYTHTTVSTIERVSVTSPRAILESTSEPLLSGAATRMYSDLSPGFSDTTHTPVVRFYRDLTFAHMILKIVSICFASLLMIGMVILVVFKKRKEKDLKPIHNKDKNLSYISLDTFCALPNNDCIFTDIHYSSPVVH